MTLSVTQLGYVALDVTDLDAWRRMGSEIFDFEVIDANDSCLFRIDERPCRISLRSASGDGIACSGWEAGDPGEYEALRERLRRAGVELSEGSPGDCAARGVAALTRFRDPGGFNLELYHTPRLDRRVVRHKAPTSGFKAGDMGLGHIVLHYAERDSAVDFYREILGFRVTDTCKLKNADVLATFLRCNSRHHSLAIIAGVPGRAGQISHLMVEANVMEDVGRAYELCLAKKLPMGLTLGQHTNDRMLSFYLQTPSGFALEFGYGGIEIDDASWEIKHWDTGSFWGHAKNAAP